MSYRRLVAFVVFAFPLCACGPPVLDTSSPEQFVASMEEIRLYLDPEELVLLEDAFAYFTDSADYTRDPETLGPVIEACSRIEGMTAREIILEAWDTRVGIVGDRITALTSRRDASASDREVLSGFEIVKARLYRADPTFVRRLSIEASAAGAKSNCVMSF